MNVHSIYQKAGRALSAPLAEKYFTPAPSYLFLELIRRCTHRCGMCNIWQEATDGMPFDEIQRIFSAPLFHDVERIILTGGEPTLRRDLCQITEFFLDTYPKLKFIALLTTGFGTERIIAQSETILKCMENDPRKPHLLIQLSFDGIGDTYNEIRNISKAWDQTYGTVLALQELQKSYPHLDLMLHAVIQPLNVRELDRLDTFAAELGIPILYSLAVISDTYFNNTSLQMQLAFSDEELALVKEFLGRPHNYGSPEIPLYYQDLVNMMGGATRERRCMMGYYMMYVQMDGKVYPCVNSGDYLLGDLHIQSAEDIWFGEEANHKRALVRKEFCPTCTSACYSDITGLKELITAARYKMRHWLGAG